VDAVLANGLLAARAGRSRAVIDLLAPSTGSGRIEGRPLPEVNRCLSRMLLATAWQRLGQPDSAASHLMLVLGPGRYEDSYIAASLVRPFALQQLIVLEAQLGQLSEARRHWRELEADATAADERFRSRMAETRRALALAETAKGVRLPAESRR
jgi:hypothetical protein